MQHFDYIIAGGGASGLLLAYRLAGDPFFEGTSIAIIEKDEKNTNDRTWCFWEAPNGEFDHLLHQKWQYGLFKSEGFKRSFPFAPYEYKMLRSSSFYSFIREKIAEKGNFKIIKETVISAEDTGTQVVVKTHLSTYTCQKCFSSIFNAEVAKGQTRYPLLQQHFIGWFVKTETAVFNAEQATFMDFDLPQRGNTRFMYVLPFSETEALLEYTLFSEKLLSTDEYEAAIKDYLNNLGVKNYEITEKEQGSIPMSSYPFWKENTQNLMYIGSAGGWTKASTGYTFLNSVRKTKALAQFLKSGKPLNTFQKRNRFWYYDLLLLDILYEKNHEGSRIFASLFKRNQPFQILKFLDEQTTFLEDLKVMTKAPTWVFLRAVWKRGLG